MEKRTNSLRVENETIAHRVEIERLRVDRLKIYGNIATVIITVGLGTLGVAIINSAIQGRQLEQQRLESMAQVDLQERKAEADRRQAEMKYLGEYLTFALEDDVNKRIRFAEYFAYLTISEDIQKKWAEYHKNLESKKAQFIEAEAKLEVAREAKDDETVIALQFEVAALKSQLRPLKREDILLNWQPSDVQGIECYRFERLRGLIPHLVEPHSIFGSVSWRLQRKGVQIEGGGIETTGGAPDSARRVWDAYGKAIGKSSEKYKVPVELLIAHILTETLGDSEMVRIEPGYVSDNATPHRVSAGLNQMLISTARIAMDRPSIDRAWLQVPQNSIDAAAAYIARQSAKTNFDPPKVAAAVNSGAVIRNDSPDNRWKMRQFPFGTSEYTDRFVTWFNDAMRVMILEPTPPPFSFAACIH